MNCKVCNSDFVFWRVYKNKCFCPNCGEPKFSDDLFFSDRRVRDYLVDKEIPLSLISLQLKMSSHHVLESLLKLYKNGEIDYHKTKGGVPCFFAVREEQ